MMRENKKGERKREQEVNILPINSEKEKLFSECEVFDDEDALRCMYANEIVL